MTRTLIASTCAIALAFLTSGFAAAQAPTGNLADLWIVYPKDGQNEKFQEAFKKHTTFRRSKGDARDWQVFSPFIGNQLGHYVVRACCASWSDMDAYAQWTETSGVGEHWDSNVDRYVERYQHALTTEDFENSHWPESDEIFPLVGVTTFFVKPGRVGAINRAKARMSQLAKKGKWPRHWAWGSAVGGPSRLILVSPHENFASMAPPEQNFVEFLAQQTGSAGETQALWDQFNGSVSHTDYTVYRHVPDMSMSPK